MPAISLLRPVAASTPAVDTLGYAVFETAAGPVYIAESGGVVRYADLAVDESTFVEACARRLGRWPEREDQLPSALQRAVRRFLDGEGRFDGPVDLTGLTDFQQRVLRKTMEIRRGEVRSYQWIAREIGAPLAVRAVGSALGRNPIPILIPCHRVVRSDYQLGEYGAGGTAKKRELLELEGVDVGYLESLAARGIRFQGSSTTHIFCVPFCYTGRRIKPQYQVFFSTVEDARAAGFRPCKVCRPAPTEHDLPDAQS